MKIIFPIILLIISVVTFVFLSNPLYKEISTLRSDISIYNTAINDSTDLGETQNSLVTTYNEIKESDKERLNNFLPSSVNNIGFILEVERLANLHSMPIKNIKFEPIRETGSNPTDLNTIASDVPVDNKPYGVFPIDFTVTGKYDDFNLFLKDLEYNLRLVDVKAISFTVPERDKTNTDEGFNPDVYDYNLKVEIYWLK